MCFPREFFFSFFSPFDVYQAGEIMMNGYENERKMERLRFLAQRENIALSVSLAESKQQTASIRNFEPGLSPYSCCETSIKTCCWSPKSDEIGSWWNNFDQQNTEQLLLAALEGIPNHPWQRNMTLVR